MNEYIFESHDNGITVYKRVPGSLIKELVKVSFDVGDQWNKRLRHYDWDSLAEDFPSIEEKIQELLVLAELCKK